MRVPIPQMDTCGPPARVRAVAHPRPPD